MNRSIQEKTSGHLVSLLNNGPKPILLIGAGASIKSGIPSTNEFIGLAAKWAYAREQGWPPEDIKIRQSDWQPWLENQSWYDSSISQSENYPQVVENLLQPRQARKDFFLKILKPDIPASIGYHKLAELIGYKAFETILTTNFDSLIENTCSVTSQVHHLTVVKNHDEIPKISTSPDYPQLIHLHGDFENYTDKNLLEEIETLNVDLVNRIIPIVRDHPLIVVGYRGAENSIMNDLLLNNSDNAENYKHGIYWCVLEDSQLSDLTENVRNLSNKIGNNFQIVQIKGFDELISEGIWQRYAPRLETPSDKRFNSQLQPEIHDFKPLTSSSQADLDSLVLRARIIRYCESLSIWAPQEITESWLTSVQIERDLIVKLDDEIKPTFAGYMLFGKQPQVLYPDAQIKIIIEHNELWLNHIFKGAEDNSDENIVLEHIVTGNLWEQLDELNDLISQFNKPFRLKGQVSEMVLPYPPIAIKELIVNSLVHRDYSKPEQITIQITPTFIDITNPGGLVSDVKLDLESETIEDKIKKGKRGIKGYRNPVLADFFYGSGAMDKAGSGLSDVYESVEQMGGAVNFGPIDNNSRFNARIYSRPEIVDIITKTAAPILNITSSLVSNVLEFVSLPEQLWTAKTDFKFASEVWDAFGGQWVPPFILKNGQMYSFYNLDRLNNLFSSYIDKGTLESFSPEEYLENESLERVFVELTNRCLYSHFYALGLINDKEKKRAYFPKLSDEENRTITYQARVKSATRTIAKRVIKKSTEEIMYWEHKSLSFKIEKFGDAWGLVLLPSYVFTVDGLKWLVRSDKISKLATKRSARDYNQSVLNDLTFWTWVLSGGDKTNFWLRTAKEGDDPFYENRIFGISANLPKANLVELEIRDEKENTTSLDSDEEDIEDEIARMAQEELEKENEGEDEE